MHNTNPLISIAITTYDRVSLLEETINCVLKQSYSNIEVLIGNDNTKRDIKSLFPNIYDNRIKWINHEHSLGYIDNVNKLFDMSTGDYFTTISDDDLLDFDFLQKMLNIFITNKRINVVFSNYIAFNTLNEIKNLKKKSFKIDVLLLNSNEWILGYLKKKYISIGCYGLFKKEFFKKIGGVRTLGDDPGFSPYNDNLLSLESARSNLIAYTYEPLVYYRMHLGSPSYTNKSLSAYFTAQQDFIKYANHIFSLDKNPENIKIYHQSLITWFFSDYCFVLRRSGKLTNSNLFNYLKFVKKYTSSNLYFLNKIILLLKHIIIMYLRNFKLAING